MLVGKRRTGFGARAPAALWLACVMAAVVESGGASSARDVRHGSRVSGLPSQQEDVGIFCNEGSGPWGGSAEVPMHGRGSALHGGSIYGLGAHTTTSWVEREDDTTTTGVSSDGVGAAEDVRAREVGSSTTPEEDRRGAESVTYDSESAGIEVVQKRRKSTRSLRADGDLSEVVDREGAFMTQHTRQKDTRPLALATRHPKKQQTNEFADTHSHMIHPNVASQSSISSGRMCTYPSPANEQ